MSLALVFVVAIMAMRIAPASAQWPQGFSVVVGTDQAKSGVNQGVCYPGETSGDLYVAFGAWGGVGLADWQVAHLGTNGQLLWSATDVHLLQGVRIGFEPGFAPMDPGGFVHAFPFQNGTILDMDAVIGDASGVMSPHLDIGTPVLSYSGYAPSCCRADGGGAFVAWVGSSNLKVQRLDANGAVAPGWPSAGWAPNPGIGVSYPYAIATAPDGTGGLLVAAIIDPASGPFVQRVAGDTTVASGWPAQGLLLITSQISGIPNGLSPATRLVRSDATHFFAVWVDKPPAGGERVMCQRFSLSGTLDPAWPPDGVRVDSLGSDSHDVLTCLEDGAGGVTVGWRELRRYRVRHIRADGTMPGLYAGGPVTLFSGPNTSGPVISTLGGLARGKNDGCCVFWDDMATGIHGRWFDGDGNMLGCGAPGDTCSALILPGPLSAWRVPAAMADGNGGAYILYTYDDGTFFTGAHSTHYVTHAHYLGDATTSVSPVGAKSSLALAVSPNPARGALLARFTLPDVRPARLELLDLAGRRVLARDVSGAGDHVETLEVPGSLPPGVYVVSVAQGSERRTTRAAIVR